MANFDSDKRRKRFVLSLRRKARSNRKRFDRIKVSDRKRLERVMA